MKEIRTHRPSNTGVLFQTTQPSESVKKVQNQMHVFAHKKTFLSQSIFVRIINWCSAFDIKLFSPYSSYFILPIEIKSDFGF